MKSYVTLFRDLPLPARFAVAGATSAGAIGAIAGLVIGLLAYAPTAPFAVIELAVPASIAGGVVGLIAGSLAALVANAAHRIKRPKAPSR